MFSLVMLIFIILFLASHSPITTLDKDGVKTILNIVKVGTFFN